MSVNAINSLIVWRIIAISVLCLQTRPCKTNAFPSKSFLRCMNCIRFRKVIENSVPIAHLSIDHDMVNMTRPITAYIYVDCSSLSSHRCLLEILVSTFLPTAYLSDCIFRSIVRLDRFLCPISWNSFLRFALLFTCSWLANENRLDIAAPAIHFYSDCPYYFAFLPAVARYLLVAVPGRLASCAGANATSFIHFSLTPRSRSFPLNVFLVI